MKALIKSTILLFVATSFSLALAHEDHDHDTAKMVTLEELVTSLDGADRDNYEICQAIYDRKTQTEMICLKMVLDEKIDFLGNDQFTSCYIALRSATRLHPDIAANKCIGKEKQLPFKGVFLTMQFSQCVKKNTLLDSDTQFKSESIAKGRCTNGLLDPDYLDDFSNDYDVDALVK